MERLAGILLFGIVLISGCTTSVATGNGVVVESFGPDLPEAFLGEQVNFKVRMRNIGSVTATNVFAELIGLDQDWYDPAMEPVGGGPWEGTVDKWKRPNQPECRYGGSGFTLRPPDLTAGIMGEEHVCTWTYKVPQDLLPHGLSLTYRPVARVFYTYETDVISTVTIVPRQELVRIQSQGGALPAETTSTTDSPVAITVQTEGPIRLIGNTVTFDVTVAVENQGGGIVCSDTTDISRTCSHRNPLQLNPELKWNELSITIEEFKKLPNPVPRPPLQLTNCGGEPILLGLFQGETNHITCEARIDFGTTVPAVPTDYVIHVHADYSYLIDEETAITVRN